MRSPAAGYDVRMIATRHEPWATATDRDVRSRRSFPVEVINYRRDEDPLDVLPVRRTLSRPRARRLPSSASSGRR